MGLRLEQRAVTLQLGAEIAEVERILPLVLEQHAIAFAHDGAFVRSGARHRALDEVLVDRLDNDVDAHELIVHIETGVRFARRRQPEALEQPHGDALLDQRIVLRDVVDHERLQPQEALIGHEAIDVDSEPGFLLIAAAAAARPDPNVADPQPAPGDVGRVIRVVEIVGLQPRPVVAVNLQAQLLHRFIAEERVRVERRSRVLCVGTCAESDCERHDQCRESDSMSYCSAHGSVPFLVALSHSRVSGRSKPPRLEIQLQPRDSTPAAPGVRAPRPGRMGFLSNRVGLHAAVTCSNARLHPP